MECFWLVACWAMNIQGCPKVHRESKKHVCSAVALTGRGCTFVSISAKPPRGFQFLQLEHGKLILQDLGKSRFIGLWSIVQFFRFFCNIYMEWFEKRRNKYLKYLFSFSHQKSQHGRWNMVESDMSVSLPSQWSCLREWLHHILTHSPVDPRCHWLISRYPHVSLSSSHSLFAIWGVDLLGLDPLLLKSQKNPKKSQKFMSDCGITKRQ